MLRREALQSLAALAAPKWGERDIDPDDLATSEGVGEVWWRYEPDFVMAQGEGIVGSYWIQDEEVEDRFAGIHSDAGTVTVILNGSNDDVDGGALAKFSPEKAREVAVSMYMAAEEATAKEGEDE